MATSITELKRQFTEKANAVELLIECLSDGDINSELLIVSEAPGARECELKLPLVGGSGSFLWQTLSRFSITRRQCYITNVIKRRIVEQRFAKSKEVPKNELAHWHSLLRWEIAQLPNVKYILVLGDYALEALIGINGIDKWRGSVLQHEGKTYIVANNPAHIMRKSYLEPIFTQDLYKLNMVRNGDWSEYNIKHLYDPSPKEAIAWCDKMIHENTPVSFDIETIGGETACVGFANSAHEGMCINFRDRETNRWSVRDESSVRFAIQRVLRHAKVRLVAQNGGFDCGWLWYKDRIKPKPLYMDTLLAHHTLYPIWPHNLGFLTAQYTTHSYYKDDGDEWREGGDISTFWMYNVKDVCITWEVARRLEQELRSEKMWDFFVNHVMHLQPYLIEATVLGNRIDLEMRERLHDEYNTLVEGLRTSFVEQARVLTRNNEAEYNPNSPKQLAALIFGALKLTGRTLSTDRANLVSMAESIRTPEPARKLLTTLIEYKREHKLLSTYINAKADEDNRMRSDYKQYGTQFVPGRLSSAQTLWGSGMNLQNQPERLRGMFIADKMVIND